VMFGFLFALPPFYRWLPYHPSIEWARSGGILWGVLTTGVCAVELAVAWYAGRSARNGVKHDPGRRAILNAVRAAAFAAPAAALGYGVFIARRHFQLKEVELHVAGLAVDLDGLRIVQLTDIHMGAYLDRQDLEHAIGMANETRAHLALVTGDLITMRRDPLDRCIDALSALRADAGVLGCLGNHEIVGNCEAEAAKLGARAGIRFLRGERTSLRFGDAFLNVAGVDYQRQRHVYLKGAGKLVQPGEFNVLLSHNPDVFPVAAEQGYDLTIAGHTHGGQVTVEILHQYLNVMRFFTPYVYGLYERQGRSIWVSRGLGTVGVPARIGAPPEVALIRLCAT
jgi:uncharacterized protein